MANISQSIADQLFEIKFSNAAGIDDYFQRGKGCTFIRWFNETLSGRGIWAGVALVDTRVNDVGFQRFWNQAERVFGAPVNLAAFTALMCVLANEVRGNFTPVAEKLGRRGHPGLAYAFNRIEGVKRSYNTLAGNKTAFDCFHDDHYLEAHATLALGSRFSRTTDTRWQGETYPSQVPTSTDLGVAGFLMQADFMKFRGRGFIQTTGRANYEALIRFVQETATPNATLEFFRIRWQGLSPETVAFQTTNDDWDALFGKTDLILAAQAIRIHNAASGNYLALSPEAVRLQGEGPGSLHHMGLRISGSAAYAAKFRDRAIAVLSEIL